MVLRARSSERTSPRRSRAACRVTRSELSWRENLTRSGESVRAVSRAPLVRVSSAVRAVEGLERPRRMLSESGRPPRRPRAPRVPCHACRVGATVKSVFFENFLSPKISKKGPDIVHRGPFRRTHSDPPKKSSREVFFP